MSGVTYYGDYPEDYADIVLPFNTFTSDDPAASATVTDLVDADIKVHKDGSATAIATDSATITINFASVTGNHIITIDTSANGNYTAGSEYMVRIEGVTVDAGTINAWIGSFSIERPGGTLALLKGANGVAAIKTDTAGIQTDLDNGTDGLGAIKTAVDGVSAGSSPQVLQTTTIATLATQQSFTLTAGSADDDAYIGCLAIITDQATSTQKCVGTISDYTGSTKTVTLQSDPGIFTMIATDNIDIVAALPEIPADWITAAGTAADFTTEIQTGLATTSSIVDAFYDEATSGHTTAGTFGKAISDVLVDTDSLVTTVGTAGDGLTAINLPNQTMDITGNLSGSVGSVTAEVTADITKINGSATSAVNLALSTGAILVGTCEGTPTTTVIQTDLSETSDDALIGATVLFITSGSSQNERKAIIDYDGTTGTITVAALANAPAAADPFIII